MTARRSLPSCSTCGRTPHDWIGDGVTAPRVSVSLTYASHGKLYCQEHNTERAAFVERERAWREQLETENATRRAVHEATSLLQQERLSKPPHFANLPPGSEVTIAIHENTQGWKASTAEDLRAVLAKTPGRKPGEGEAAHHLVDHAGIPPPAAVKLLKDVWGTDMYRLPQLRADGRRRAKGDRVSCRFCQFPLNSM
jgi:hypothetical protein